jgi:hypothetical protein
MEYSKLLQKRIYSRFLKSGALLLQWLQLSSGPYLQINCVVFMILLSGCGSDDFSDLTRYIAEVKARPK